MHWLAENVLPYSAQTIACYVLAQCIQCLNPIRLVVNINYNHAQFLLK